MFEHVLTPGAKSPMILLKSALSIQIAALREKRVAPTFADVVVVVVVVSSYAPNIHRLACCLLGTLSLQPGLLLRCAPSGPFHAVCSVF